jgi:hypothetical protein
MSMSAQPVPPQADIATLKRLAAGIIRVQGNRFIKDLLRAKGIPIGANKDEFQLRLAEAIENGQLALDDIREWLANVEGWGNQHVYLYTLSLTLRRTLVEADIRKRVSDADLDSVWNGETTLAFPDEPTLTSISFSDSVLRILWQESSPSWVPAPEKTYTQEEGLDLYEYRAFRQIERRAITRFEARVKDGTAALFISDPIQGAEHKSAINEAHRVIGLLMDLAALKAGMVNIARVSRNLDQRNVPTNNSPAPEVKAQRSRLASGGSYVEFAANSSDKAYWEETAVQDVRNSVRAEQLPAFDGAEGVFIFQPTGDGLSRPFRVQLYGKDNRIRLWAQMEASEAWTILLKLKANK